MQRKIKKAPRELVVVTGETQQFRPDKLSLDAPGAPALESIAELVRRKGSKLKPLFGISPERLRMKSFPAAPVMSRALTRFYRVEAPDERLEEIATSLREHEAVETAFIKPSVEPAVLLNAMAPSVAEPPMLTPDFTGRQGYLDQAPGGVDAKFAWTLAGGSGDGVSIVDIEGEWRFSHEDLIENEGGVVSGTPPNDLGWRNHGTAVLGEFHGDRNSFGVTGICPTANVRGISVFDDGAAAAIRLAADMLGSGDIILVELHYPGPRFNFEPREDQLGYIPAEWWPDNFTAIQYATQKGIIVVEAAGNGAENLDDPLYDQNPDPPQGPFPAIWSNPFRRNQLDSGAILVGAGAPPPGTHGQNWGPDRSKLDFSNYGSMVDVQGWGREVTTCGYGDLQGGDNEDVWYTDEFSGTSSASPIVVGVLGCLQGILRASGQQILTPNAARMLLRNGGSPQTAGPASPIAQRIGNRPDLRSLVGQLIAGVPQASTAATSVPVHTININLSETKMAHIVNVNLGTNR